MLAASAVFYLSLEPAGYLVLLASAALTWFCALRAPAAKRWFAPLGLAAALAPLLLLKYYVAAAGGLAALTGLRLWQPQLLQPLGLGYFSLQLVSYLVDVAPRGHPAAAQPGGWCVTPRFS